MTIHSRTRRLREPAHADGTLSTVVAVKAARFKRLQLASEQLVRNAQHVAGLNPRAFRWVPPSRVSCK